MLLAAVDVLIPSRRGAAVMGVARKRAQAAPAARAERGSSVRAESMV
jgi:hypothetical protein